jgi:hypothetical protein
MYVCALFMFILYTLVYLKLRGIARARMPSTFVPPTNQERNEAYEHKLARQMLLFPASVFRSCEVFKTSNTYLTDFIHHHDPSYWPLSRPRVVRPWSLFLSLYF